MAEFRESKFYGVMFANRFNLNLVSGWYTSIISKDDKSRIILTPFNVGVLSADIFVACITAKIWESDGVFSHKAIIVLCFLVPPNINAAVCGGDDIFGFFSLP